MKTALRNIMLVLVIVVLAVAFALAGIPDDTPVRHDDVPLWPTWDGYQAPTQ